MEDNINDLKKVISLGGGIHVPGGVCMARGGGLKSYYVVYPVAYGGSFSCCRY